MLSNSDKFLTICSSSEGYYMDRGSKFHAYLFPVNSEDEIHEKLTKLKKEHPKARHFCTAMRLYPDGSLERSNDDGEPSGSAGKPILGQLVKHHLTNVFAIVVRYFGGTKLGVPGLIEAYKQSTADALKHSQIVTRKVCTKINLQLPYEGFPMILNYFKQNDIAVLDESFTDVALLTIGLNKSTAHQDLFQHLKVYTQMDFDTLREYSEYLSMEITFLEEDFIY